MAGATTHYNVVTHLRARNEMSPQMGRLSRDFRGLTRLAAGLGLRLAPAYLAYQGIHKTVENLNSAMTDSLQLASSFSVAFKFDPNPVQHFNMALGQSRKLYRGLVEDAAKLPGEVSDFMEMARGMATGVFRAGGRGEHVRRITGNLTFVRPMAGAAQAVVGTHIQMMLMGQARQQMRIYQFLKGSGVLGEDVAADKGATAWNAKKASERLRLLDAALERFASNPVFRARYMHTLDTQWGTLMDSLFGAHGIGGKLAAKPFDSFLFSLERLNNWLDVNMDGIVKHLSKVPGLGGVGESGYYDPVALSKWMGTGAASKWFEGWTHEEEERRKSKFIYDAAQAKALSELQARGIPAWTYPNEGPLDAAERSWKQYWYGNGFYGGPGIKKEPTVDLIGETYRNAAELRKMMADAEKLEKDADNAENLNSYDVHQTFNVKLDLKSDVSPEAIAVNLRRGLAEATKNPKAGGAGMGPRFDPANVGLK